MVGSSCVLPDPDCVTPEVTLKLLPTPAPYASTRVDTVVLILQDSVASNWFVFTVPKMRRSVAIGVKMSPGKVKSARARALIPGGMVTFCFSSQKGPTLSLLTQTNTTSPSPQQARKSLAAALVLLTSGHLHCGA